MMKGNTTSQKLFMQGKLKVKGGMQVTQPPLIPSTLSPHSISHIPMISQLLPTSSFEPPLQHAMKLGELFKSAQTSKL